MEKDPIILDPKDEKENKPKLPEIGTRFNIQGQSYKVVYVNEGKNRFSAEPCIGDY